MSDLLPAPKYLPFCFYATTLTYMRHKTCTLVFPALRISSSNCPKSLRKYIFNRRVESRKLAMWFISGFLLQNSFVGINIYSVTEPPPPGWTLRRNSGTMHCGYKRNGLAISLVRQSPALNKLTRLRHRIPLPVRFQVHIPAKILTFHEALFDPAKTLMSWCFKLRHPLARLTPLLEGFSRRKTRFIPQLCLCETRGGKMAVLSGDHNLLLFLRKPPPPPFISAMLDYHWSITQGMENVSSGGRSSANTWSHAEKSIKSTIGQIKCHVLQCSVSCRRPK
jgi:hypothetical protein